MTAPNVRRAFVFLHLALGVGLLVSTMQTYLHQVREHGGLGFHLGLVVALEGIGAALFLIPQTLRVGGAVLLLMLLGGFVTHLTRGEFEVQLLVYAAGVLFVMVHGAEWGPSQPAAA